MVVLERYRDVSRIGVKTLDNRDSASYFVANSISWILCKENIILEA